MRKAMIDRDDVGNEASGQETTPEMCLEGDVVTLAFDRLETPVGGLVMATSGAHLVYLEFDDGLARLERHAARRYGGYRLLPVDDPLGVGGALKAYFAGKLTAIDTLSVDPGGTPFQSAVWLGLRMVPVGSTISYGAFAQRLGYPGAMRAVGRTNGSNPIAIVLPCHRVIGADNSLTGYGGGLERKLWLLRHEGALLL